MTKLEDAGAFANTSVSQNTIETEENSNEQNKSSA